MAPNRLVILLAPAFAGLAGYIADLAARYLPGAPALNKGQLAAVFIAGAGIAASHTLMWLRGHHLSMPTTITTSQINPADQTVSKQIVTSGPA